MVLIPSTMHESILFLTDPPATGATAASQFCHEYKGIQILGRQLHFLTARPFERLFTHLLDIHSLTWSQAMSEAFTLKDFPLGTSSWGFQSTCHTCSS